MYTLYYKADTHEIQLVGENRPAPAGFTNLGLIDHEDTNDPLGPQENHVLWHHIRDRLYPLGVYNVNAFSMTRLESVIKPTLIYSGDREIPEDAPVDTLLGTISLINASSPYTISLVSDGDGKVKLINDKLYIKAGLDFETKTSHTVVIAATQNGGGSNNPDNLSIIYSVTDVSELSQGPTSLSLSASSVTEHSEIDTVIGTLSAASANRVGTPTYSYSLVGVYPTVSIAGNQLIVTGDIEYDDAASFDVVVRVTDDLGLTLDHTFTVNVVEVPVETIVYPTITTVSAVAGAPVAVDDGTNWAGFPVHHYEHVWSVNDAAPVGEPTPMFLYLSNLAGDKAGADFGRKLTQTPGSGTVNVSVASTSTAEYSYAMSEAGFPGVAGYTAGSRPYTVVLGHTDAANISCTVSLYRVNAALETQAGPVSLGTQNMSGSTDTWTGNADLGQWNAGDRLLVEYRFSTNAAGKLTVINTNSTSYVICPFGVPAISYNKQDTYVPMYGDATKNLKCTVTAIGYLGETATHDTQVKVISGTLGDAAPANTTPPVIEGTIRNGLSIKVKKDGTWTKAPTKFEYRWVANDVVIPNQVIQELAWTSSLSSAYPLVAGQSLVLQVRASNAIGSSDWISSNAITTGVIPDKKWYISASKGFVGGNGKTPETAWRTLAQMQAGATTGVSLADPNYYLFKTDDEWYEKFRPRGNAVYDVYDDNGNIGAAAVGAKPRYGMGQKYAVDANADTSQVNNFQIFRHHWDRFTDRGIYSIYSNNVRLSEVEISYGGYNDATGTYTGGQQAIWKVGGQNFEVDNCYIHHGNGDAIYCDTVSSAWIHNNTILPVFGNDGDCCQFYSGGGTGANWNGTDANILVEDNYFDAWEAYTTNSAKGCFVTERTTGKLIVRNNICHGSNFGLSLNSNNVECYGNTVDHAVKNSYSFGIGSGELWDTYITNIHDNEIFNSNRAIAISGKTAGANTHCYHYDMTIENNNIHDCSRGLRRDKASTGYFQNNIIDRCSVAIENLTTILPPVPSNNPNSTGVTNPTPIYSTWTVGPNTVNGVSQ